VEPPASESDSALPTLPLIYMRFSFIPKRTFTEHRCGFTNRRPVKGNLILRHHAVQRRARFFCLEHSSPDKSAVEAVGLWNERSLCSFQALGRQIHSLLSLIAATVRLAGRRQGEHDALSLGLPRIRKGRSFAQVKGAVASWPSAPCCNPMCGG
jgi:hypothetical protein